MSCVVATSWMIQCSNPCGGDSPLRTRPDRLRGPLSLLYDGYWCSFLRVKRQGWALNTHLHLTASYTMGTAEPLLPLWTFQGMSYTHNNNSRNKSTGRHTVIFNRFEARNALRWDPNQRVLAHRNFRKENHNSHADVKSFSTLCLPIQVQCYIWCNIHLLSATGMAKRTSTRWHRHKCGKRLLA